MENTQAKVYDYIIIGTGPAGSVLANRLSGGGNSVLVLEAGPNRNDDPAVQNYNGGAMMQITKYFWSDTIESPAFLKGQTLITGSGRLAGGGSSVNGEVFVRPTPYVLEQWEKIAGPQWSADKVYDRLRKLENFNGEKTGEGVHGTEGMLDIRQTYPAGGTLLQKLSDSIAESSGCPVIEDYNNPSTPIGPYLRLQVYQKPSGKRASASIAFLGNSVANEEGSGIGDYSKLQIMYETTATKVLFNNNKQADGVEYICRGICDTVKASKKVIMCAGLRSAWLLQQSGVGPRAVLEQAGIKVVHDSPKVGQTLVNDAYARAIFMVNPDDVTALEKTDAGTYWRSGAFLPGLGDQSKAKNKRQYQFLFMYIGNNMLQLIILDIDPKSRGRIKAQSTDPLKTMSLDEGFLSDPADIGGLKEVYRTYVKGAADVLTSQDPAYRLVSPSPDELADDSKLEDYIRTNFVQSFHDQCSLAMGSTSDAAVNGWCEVNGVENLMVADASVIPYHVDGNPSASSYVIGETIAAHLLGEE